MTRKKLPAYGSKLLERRRRGDHPLCVHFVFGFQWSAKLRCRWAGSIADAHPLLALKSLDYVPGVYDFGLVMGLRVAVFDQQGWAGHYEDPALGPARPGLRYFYDLLGELAEYAAEIEVHSPAFEEPRMAHEIAFCMRAPRDGVHVWPHWWSDSINEKHAKRRTTWLRAVGELRGLDAVCA